MVTGGGRWADQATRYDSVAGRSSYGASVRWPARQERHEGGAASAAATCAVARRPARCGQCGRDEAARWRLSTALEERDGPTGAHAVHELWMRNEPPMNIERMLVCCGARPPNRCRLAADALRGMAAAMYQVAGRFVRSGRGKSNLYLVLLDYEDSARGPFGVYVGATQYTPAARFDQHKSGIRAAGSVLKRGLEVLTGPVLHLQRVPRAQAAEIEEVLAEALRAEGLSCRAGTSPARCSDATRSHGLSSLCGNDLNFNLVGICGELCLDGGTGGRMALGHPGIPDRVHLRERAHVGQVNGRGKNPRLVRAGLAEQAVDRCEDLAGLARDVLGRVVGDLARKVDDAAVHDGLRHARTDVLALNHQGADRDACLSSRKQ